MSTVRAGDGQLPQSFPARSHAAKLLRWYTGAIIGLTLLAWGLAALRYWGFHGSVWSSWLLYKPELRFSDLTSLLATTKHPIGHGAAIEKGPPIFNLAAPAIFFYWLAGQFGVYAVAFVVTAVMGTAAACCVALNKAMKWRGIDRVTRVSLLLASLMTSYPLLVECDRANIEGAVWIILAGAFYYYRQARLFEAGILIAMAGSIKPFPLIFLVLFCTRGRVAPLLGAVGTFGAVNVLSFWAFGPTIKSCFVAYLSGLADYSRVIVKTFAGTEIIFDHSVFSIVKQFAMLAVWNNHVSHPDHLISLLYLPYLAMATVFTIVILLKVRKMPVVNQVMVCFLLMVLLPPANFDYTLVQLYIPWSFFVLYVARPGNPMLVSVQYTAMICFAIVFTPQTFLRITYFGISGQVKVLFMIALLWTSLRYPMLDADLSS